MTAAAVTRLGVADGAARAAAPLLPSSKPLAVGAASQEADQVPPDGQAVYARFAGAAEGQIAIIAGQELVDAFAADPAGGVDLAQGVRPALEAAAATLGTVVVDPSELLTAQEVLATIMAAGGVLVPLTSDTATVAVLAVAVAAQPAGAADEAAVVNGSGLLHEVELEVVVELGRTRMNVRELLALTPGTVVELDRSADAPTDLLLNGRPIGCGELVVLDENFAIRISEVRTINWQ